MGTCDVTSHHCQHRQRPRQRRQQPHLQLPNHQATHDAGDEGGNNNVGVEVRPLFFSFLLFITTSLNTGTTRQNEEAVPPRFVSPCSNARQRGLLPTTTSSLAQTRD